MTDDVENWIDPDIRQMKLSYEEKSGLQVYRNYKKAFDKEAKRRFIEGLNLEKFDISDYKRVSTLFVDEDPRVLPVIACAYADEAMKAAFKKAISDSVPGGKASLFSDYGPLSDLAKRIQLGYAFNVFSPFLMEELNRIRKVRNKISHSWDFSATKDFFKNGHLADELEMEKAIFEKEENFSGLKRPTDPIAGFRVRVVFLLAFIRYESEAYYRAQRARLPPFETLYGEPKSDLLHQLSLIAQEVTRTICLAAENRRT